MYCAYIDARKHKDKAIKIVTIDIKMNNKQPSPSKILSLKSKTEISKNVCVNMI